MWKISNTYNFNELINEFDWLSDMKGVPQDPIYHAEGDVYIHTQMVVEALQEMQEFKDLPENEQHLILAAALMHDIEKRSTTIIENGRISSPSHAKKGEKTVRTFFYKQGNTPFNIREYIAKLVRLHGLPIWAIEKPNFEKVLLQASLVVNTYHLYILAKADILGRKCNDHREMLDRIEFFATLCQELECWKQPFPFKSKESKFTYFIQDSGSRLYEPFTGNNFEVILMSALPGSGKDTYINKNLGHLPIISLDEIRRAHKIKPTDKSGNGKVIQMAKEKARELLRSKTPFVWNATNITKQLRTQLIALFADYGAQVKIIYVETSYKELLKRNKTRKHPLPLSVLEKMISKLEPPTADECADLEIIQE
ncbi:MAG: AAA family ATPase [Crocinitomix sp.]|nr:AAA family ATPase [Crocinitomix sp.]